MRPKIRKRLTVFIAGLIAYQIVEVIAILPTTEHWHGNVISGLILAIIGFGLVIWWLTRAYQKTRRGLTPPDDDSMPLSASKLRLMLPGFLIMAGVQILASAVVNSGLMPPSTNEQAIDSAMSGNPAVMLLIVVLLGPIVEELLFRGLLMNLAFSQRTRSTQIFNMILSSGAFAIVHVPNNLFDFATYALLGLGLSLTYTRTRDLRCGMVLHVLNNLIASFI